MRKHHSDLCWSLFMLSTAMWVYWFDRPVWVALFLTFSAGYMLNESLTEWMRHYERLIADLEAER